MTVELSDPEMMRYNRQIVLRGFDFEARKRSRRPACWLWVLAGWAARQRNIWLRRASAA